MTTYAIGTIALPAWATGLSDIDGKGPAPVTITGLAGGAGTISIDAALAMTYDDGGVTSGHPESGTAILADIDVTATDGARVQVPSTVTVNMEIASEPTVITQDSAPVLAVPTAGNTARSAYDAGTPGTYSATNGQTATISAIQMRSGGGDVADSYILPEGAGLAVRETVTTPDGASEVFESAAVTVQPVPNDPPVAAADTATVAAGGTVQIDVLANDTDLDGDALSVTEATATPAGTVTIGPAPGYVLTYDATGVPAGTDVSIFYTVTDGIDPADGTVTVTVEATAPAPTSLVPDPGFDDPAAWSYGVGWDVTGSRLVHLGSTSGTSMNSANGSFVPLQEGKEIEFSVDVVRAAEGGRLRFVVKYYDDNTAGGTLLGESGRLGGSTHEIFGTGTLGPWTGFPVPAGATHGQINIIAIDGEMDFDLDNVVISQPAVVAPTVSATLPDLTLTEGEAMEATDLSAGFTSGGGELTFALAPSSAALPAGLSLSSEGVLSGAPTVTADSLSIVVRATNSVGSVDSAFSLTVEAATAASPEYLASDGSTYIAPNGGTETFSLSDLSVAEGDVVLIPLAVADSVEREPTVTTAGYVELPGANLWKDGGQDSSLRVFGKVMGATPDADVTVAGAHGSQGSGTALAYVIRNAGVTDLSALTVATATFAAGQITPPSLLDVPAGAMVVAIGVVAHQQPSTRIALTAPDLENMVGYGDESGSRRVSSVYAGSRISAGGDETFATWSGAPAATGNTGLALSLVIPAGSGAGSGETPTSPDPEGTVDFSTLRSELDNEKYYAAASTLTVDGETFTFSEPVECGVSQDGVGWYKAAPGVTVERSTQATTMLDKELDSKQNIVGAERPFAIHGAVLNPLRLDWDEFVQGWDERSAPSSENGGWDPTLRATFPLEMTAGDTLWCAISETDVRLADGHSIRTGMLRKYVALHCVSTPWPTNAIAPTGFHWAGKTEQPAWTCDVDAFIDFAESRGPNGQPFNLNVVSIPPVAEFIQGVVDLQPWGYCSANSALKGYETIGTYRPGFTHYGRNQRWYVEAAALHLMGNIATRAEKRVMALALIRNGVQHMDACMGSGIHTRAEGGHSQFYAFPMLTALHALGRTSEIETLPYTVGTNQFRQPFIADQAFVDKTTTPKDHTDPDKFSFTIRREVLDTFVADGEQWITLEFFNGNPDVGINYNRLMLTRESDGAQSEIYMPYRKMRGDLNSDPTLVGNLVTGDGTQFSLRLPDGMPNPPFEVGDICYAQSPAPLSVGDTDWKEEPQNASDVFTGDPLDGGYNPSPDASYRGVNQFGMTVFYLHALGVVPNTEQFDALTQYVLSCNSGQYPSPDYTFPTQFGVSMDYNLGATMWANYAGFVGLADGMETLANPVQLNGAFFASGPETPPANTTRAVWTARFRFFEDTQTNDTLFGQRKNGGWRYNAGRAGGPTALQDGSEQAFVYSEGEPGSWSAEIGVVQEIEMDIDFSAGTVRTTINGDLKETKPFTAGNPQFDPNQEWIAFSLSGSDANFPPTTQFEFVSLRTTTGGVEAEVFRVDTKTDTAADINSHPWHRGGAVTDI